MATPNLGLGAEESLSCFLRWKKYSQDVSFEKAGWYLDLHEQKQLEQNVTVDLNHENYLRFLGMNCIAVSPAQHVEIEPLSGGRRSAHLAGDPFIMTSTVEKSFEIVWLAVNQKCHVLLYSPAGAGKTALISKLARESRNRDGNQVLSPRLLLMDFGLFLRTLKKHQQKCYLSYYLYWREQVHLQPVMERFA